MSLNLQTITQLAQLNKEQNIYAVSLPSYSEMHSWCPLRTLTILVTIHRIFAFAVSSNITKISNLAE